MEFITAVSLFVSLLVNQTNMWTAVEILTGLSIFGFILGRLKFITPMLLLFTGVCYLFICTGRFMMTGEEFKMISTVFGGASIVCVVAVISSFLRIVSHALFYIFSFRKKDESSTFLAQ